MYVRACVLCACVRACVRVCVCVCVFCLLVLFLFICLFVFEVQNSALFFLSKSQPHQLHAPQTNATLTLVGL